MIYAVFDCNVIVAGCGWRSEPHLCWLAVARRRVRAFATERLLAEFERVMKRLESEGVFRSSAWPLFNWFRSVCRLVEPAPLGKQRSRDASDDPCLGCGLAAKAEYIVTRDPDLLALEKPFGVEVLTPRALLSRLAANL